MQSYLSLVIEVLSVYTLFFHTLLKCIETSCCLDGRKSILKHLNPHSMSVMIVSSNDYHYMCEEYV